MAMKKGRCNVVGFTLVFVLLVIGSMVGCKQDSDSSVCKCPNGTNHYPNDCTCGADDCNCINELANNQTATITLTWDDDATTTATVKGELTYTQWNGLAQRIETALQEGYNSGTARGKGRFVNVFGGGETEIVIEKNVAGNWSVSNMFLITFDFNYLKSLDDEALATVITEAVTEMSEADEP